MPLIIHHPLSPFKGQHYKYPVESVDVYATLNEIMKLPISRERACGGFKCKPLSGKSLAPVLLGKTLYEQNFGAEKFGVLYKLGSYISQLTTGTKKKEEEQPVALTMPQLEHNFALSQAIRCAPRTRVVKAIDDRMAALKEGAGKKEGGYRVQREHFWDDCDMGRLKNVQEAQNKVIVLGYAMRTPEYRYVVYFHFNRTTELPMIQLPPFAEELYDHKNESLSDFTHRETFNLAVRPTYNVVIQSLRTKLVDFIQNHISFGDH